MRSESIRNRGHRCDWGTRSDGRARRLRELGATPCTISLFDRAGLASANRFTESVGCGVVLRFGWFYGPGATHSEEFLSLARRFGICVMFGAAHGHLSSILMVDVGSALAAALARERR